MATVGWNLTPTNRPYGADRLAPRTAQPHVPAHPVQRKIQARLAAPGTRRVGSAAMGKRTIRTPKNRAAVLAALAEGWSACLAATGGHRLHVRLDEWRQADPQFAGEVNSAIEAATDLLEDEARRRAMDCSDLLLIFLLRARRPRLYHQKQVLTVGGDMDNPLLVHQTGGPSNVHFHMPSNGRDRPEALEGHVEDDAAA